MVFLKQVKLIIILIVVFTTLPAFGKGKISKISIIGNRKIETETIKYKLHSKKGSSYSSSKIKKDIKSIFSLGYCNDITVKKTILSNGNYHLKYFIVEKPVINKFEYEGLSEIGISDVKDENKIKTYSIINRTKLNKTVKKIEALYEKKGFYLAEVTYEISKPVDNEVIVTFKINEHDKVLIKKIILLGNKRFSDQKLKSIIQTKEGEVTSWMTSKGTFNEDFLKIDIDRIKYFYMTFGYIQVKIDKPEIVLSPDKKFIYTTINITEGLSFDVGSIDITGNFLAGEPKEKLLKKLSIKKDNVFNRDSLSKDIQNITQVYEDYGYAFANVIPKTLVNEKQRKIFITLDIDKGKIVYFGKITVKGNTRTRDKVVRRELKIKEGTKYHGSHLRQSRENVFRLGYFSEVNLTTPHSKNKKNVLDVELSLKEKQTGSLQIGAGFSSYEKFMATAQVSENNLFGFGQTLSLKGQYAKRSKDITASFDEPYVLDTIWSAGSDFYYKTSKSDDYEQKTIGGAIRGGYPIGEFSRLYATTKAEYVFLNDNSYQYDTFRFPSPHNDKRFYIMDDDLIYALQLTVARDTRDNRFDPTSGSYASAAYEYSFGSFQFHQLSLGAKYFHPLFWSLVSRTYLRYGYLHPSGGKGIPVNRRYSLGGVFTVRGYINGSIGPKTTVTRNILGLPIEYNYTYGGVHKFVFNKEIQFDIIKEARLKGVIFFDAGNTYDEFDSLSSKLFKAAGNNRGIYMSVGWGFRWFSPIGPLRFEFGYPIPYKNGYNFEFMIGNFF